jgi:hypothetical protein
MYFNELLESLNNENTNAKRMSKIINPFSLYYLCDHFFGNEFKKFNVLIPNNKNDILVTRNINFNDFDIVHCEVKLLERFYNNILTKINKRIILTTGQWQLPQVNKSSLTELILNNPNVVLWISQNPIYEDNPKYLAFPYGICHDSLESYSNTLLKNSNSIKSKEIINLPMGKTHICRNRLPLLKPIPSQYFYSFMANARYILSPIGDRDDCYRHYEAIGLGTIPISNVNEKYKNIFGNNMYYCDIDEMVNILKNGSLNCEYIEPDKNLICFDYYEANVRNIINKIKYP